ncbi:MAG TPA: phospholipase D-like domain-containing protein [Pseudomonadales bacterium]|nr:phospholipase D-like domain-containing protein [Pseudomonadales bacterium]
MSDSRHGISPLPVWSSEQVYFSATQWFSGIQRDINSAQHTISLQTYIFDIDTVGEPLLQALCVAAQRGVTVRVIVDGVGSAKATALLQKTLAASGAQLQIYHPFPWDWLRINNRQHSKLCLIDDQLAWVGSFNITDDHIENNGRGPDWKDCGARVAGERCLLLREFFQALWFDDIRRLSPYFLFHPITNFSPVLRKRRLRVMLQQIHAAKDRIWIVSAYFAPIQRIVRALKKASRRGVDVRVMVPKHSDVGFFPALSSTYYADLLRAGVSIHEYEKGMLHTKLILIDDSVLIGSSNMNHRSLLHDVELDIQLFSPQVKTDIADDFMASMENCRTITLENINRFYAWLLALGQIPRLLRYWL